MNELKVFGRVAVLFIAYILKLTIDRKVDKVALLKSILEFPVNLFFVGLSILVAFAISESNDTGESVEGFLLLLIYLVVAPICVVLWRRSDDALNEDKGVVCSFLFISNFIISAGMTYYVISSSL